MAQALLESLPLSRITAVHAGVPLVDALPIAAVALWKSPLRHVSVGFNEQNTDVENRLAHILLSL